MVFIAALAGALLTALAWNAAAAPPLPKTQPKRTERPLRLGVFHPRPHLCAGEEHGQQDLRILRIVYGIRFTGANRLRPPWFYKVLPGVRDGAARSLLALDSQALWGMPQYSLVAGDPDFSAVPTGRRTPPGTGPRPQGIDRLAQWRRGVLARMPEFSEAPFLSLAQFSFPNPATDPFLLTRLRGSALLPRFTSAADSLEWPCRHWPAGVRFEEGEEESRYRLRRAGGPAPFILTAYRGVSGLARALARGRIEAALVEGGQLRELLSYRALPGGTVLGRSAGTQQIVLRVNSRLREALGVQGVGILSRAVPRPRLASMAGAGFAPQGSFLHPLLTEFTEAPPGGGALTWSARVARKAWLEQERPGLPLKLAVLAHPTLEGLALAVAAQWKKTLGMTVTVEPLPAVRFLLPEVQVKFDFAITAVDLDDGSLQRLWSTALGFSGAPGEVAPQLAPATRKAAQKSESRTAAARDEPETLAQWEKRLQGELPYLPLLYNLHFLLGRSQRGYRRAAAICPACEVIEQAPYRRHGR